MYIIVLLLAVWNLAIVPIDSGPSKCYFCFSTKMEDCKDASKLSSYECRFQGDDCITVSAFHTVKDETVVTPQFFRGCNTCDNFQKFIEDKSYFTNGTIYSCDKCGEANCNDGELKVPKNESDIEKAYKEDQGDC